MDTEKEFEKNSAETEQNAVLKETENATESKESLQKKNRKLWVIIAVSVVAVAVIVAGGFLVKNIYDTKANTLKDGKPNWNSAQGKSAYKESAEVITGKEATAKAEVTGSDAINTIQSYSDEQLGLKKKDYSFMVSQQSYRIKGDSYVQVIAAVKQKNKDGTFSITPAGKYYISFDGKTVLKEDMKNPGNYEKIK